MPLCGFISAKSQGLRRRNSRRPSSYFIRRTLLPDLKLSPLPQTTNVPLKRVHEPLRLVDVPIDGVALIPRLLADI